MDTLLNQGLAYEQYVKSIITDKYQSVWIWNEIPKEILLELNFISSTTQNCDDIGCDILARKHDNTYDYIQCKNYSTLGIDNTISICDLAGFYNFVAENNIQNPIVYYSGVLSSQIQCRRKRIKYINLPHIKISNDSLYKFTDCYNIIKDNKSEILEIKVALDSIGRQLEDITIRLNKLEQEDVKVQEDVNDIQLVENKKSKKNK